MTLGGGGGGGVDQCLPYKSAVGHPGLFLGLVQENSPPNSGPKRYRCNFNWKNSPAEKSCLENRITKTV